MIVASVVLTVVAGGAVYQAVIEDPVEYDFRNLRSIREEHLGGIGAAIETEIARHETEMKRKGRDSGWHMKDGDATPYLRADILKRGKEDGDAS